MQGTQNVMTVYSRTSCAAPCVRLVLDAGVEVRPVVRGTTAAACVAVSGPSATTRRALNPAAARVAMPGCQLGGLAGRGGLWAHHADGACLTAS